jgi:hypothetical protein
MDGRYRGAGLSDPPMPPRQTDSMHGAAGIGMALLRGIGTTRGENLETKGVAQ